MKSGWGKVKAIAQYAGISQRTLRNWLKRGLRHSRLPSGTVLVEYSALDQFLKTFEVKDQPDEVDQIVGEMFSGNTK